jgi:circadian clock protein KaiC
MFTGPLSRTPVSAMPHIPSGVPNLDLVLGGGVRVGDMLMVTGPPGSGKTTLALQMAFHTAARESAACFVSTTSESPKRLLEHARSYDFYDETLIGRRLFLLSVFPLIQEGLQPVQQALEREVREREATVLVVDGLMTLYDLHPEPREVRRFLFELTAMLSTLGCTLLVTSSRAQTDDPVHAAELTMADVLISLSQPLVSDGTERRLRALKVRGQTPLLGLHGMRVDHRGLWVYPRFESLSRPGTVGAAEGRLASGLPELDGMISGGLPTGSVSALAGSVGTGKTLLSLQFLLEGTRSGETGVLLTFRETEQELITKARGFGLDLEAPLRDGRILIVYHSPVDLSVDQTMHELADTLESSACRRFVVDGIAELLEPIPEAPRRQTLLHVLGEQLRSRGITAMIPVAVSQTVGPELDLARTPLAVIAHNLLLLRYVEFQGELHRIFSILKVRDSGFDPTIRRYMIDSDGLRIFPPDDSTAGLLTGIAHLASEARVKRPTEPQDG